MSHIIIRLREKHLHHLNKLIIKDTQTIKDTLDLAESMGYEDSSDDEAIMQEFDTQLKLNRKLNKKIVQAFHDFKHSNDD